MAKKETLDTGKNIFERAMAKLPEEKRTAIADLLSNEEFVATIGEHGLMREDYSKLADSARIEAEKAKSLYESNMSWRQERIEALAKADEMASTLERMKAAAGGDGGGGNGGGGGTAAPTGLSKEDIEKIVNGRAIATETQGLQVMATLANLGTAHLHEFKEVFNAQDVIKEAQSKGLSLEAAYGSLVAPRREERNKKEIEDRIAKAREEGIREGLTKSVSAPYPINGNSAAPSTLSGLTRKGGTVNPDFSVDGAIKSLNLSRAGKSA